MPDERFSARVRRGQPASEPIRRLLGRALTVGAVLLLVLSGTGAVAGAPAAGGAGGPGSTSAGSVAQHSPDSPSTGNPATANQSDRRQFDFAIRNVSSCGVACRDVTVTAVNTGDTTARDVTVVTRLEAGGPVIWRGSESVERLDPGESTTVTKRVRPGPFGLIRVQRNDGYVTANTTVTWDGGRETFSDRRKVA